MQLSSKKKPFFILLLVLFLFCPLEHGFSQNQPTVIQNLTSSSNLIERTIQKVLGLEATLRTLQTKTINLQIELENSKELLNLSQNELKIVQKKLDSSQQDLAKVQTTADQLQSNSDQQKSLLIQASNDYKRLQAENTIIKIAGSSLILVLGGLLIWDQING